jgi:hypothetical protein
LQLIKHVLKTCTENIHAKSAVRGSIGLGSQLGECRGMCSMVYILPVLAPSFGAEP